MTTYVGLQTAVSRALSDPDNLTFDTQAVKDFIAQGMAEVARIAAQQFQEDIDVVADTFSYQLRSTQFDGVAVPEIRLVRVEVWTGTPPRFAWKIRAKAGQPGRDSLSGWEVWGGVLELPQHEVDAIIAYDPTAIIRVWGYSPYVPLVDDNDVVPLSAELEQALLTFCQVEGLRRLTGSRVLFKQWQARSNNTDVTLGGLNSDLQVAEEHWRRMKRELKVPEQNPD